MSRYVVGVGRVTDHYSNWICKNWESAIGAARLRQSSIPPGDNSRHPQGVIR